MNYIKCKTLDEYVKAYGEAILKVQELAQKAHWAMEAGYDQQKGNSGTPAQFSEEEKRAMIEYGNACCEVEHIINMIYCIPKTEEQDKELDDLNDDISRFQDESNYGMVPFTTIFPDIDVEQREYEAKIRLA